jgi:hypothetical protein
MSIVLCSKHQGTPNEEVTPVVRPYSPNILVYVYIATQDLQWMGVSKYHHTRLRTRQ